MIRLKEIREARNVTQTQLAKDIGVSNTTVSNWESGVRQPEIEMIITLADYFDISIDFLLGRNFKNRLYNQDNYILRKEQVYPILNKILDIEEQYFPNLEEFIDALIVKRKPKR